MSNQIFPDKVAKKLWLVLTLIAVSADPILSLTVLEYQNWGPEIASELSQTIVMWAGSIAAVLGLSRYAPSNSTGSRFGN